MGQNRVSPTLAGIPHVPRCSPISQNPLFPTLAGVPPIPHVPRAKMRTLGRELMLESVAEAFEERAAILEHDGGMSREEAEMLARRMTGYEGA